MAKYKRKTAIKYRYVTPATIAKFQVLKIAHGNNGAEAIRELEGDDVNEYRRSWLLNNKAKELDAGSYVDGKLQQGAIEGVERVLQVIQNPDDALALKASMFVIDHVRGKALQRSESKHLNLNIEGVLE